LGRRARPRPAGGRGGGRAGRERAAGWAAGGRARRAACRGRTASRRRSASSQRAPGVRRGRRRAQGGAFGGEKGASSVPVPFMWWYGARRPRFGGDVAFRPLRKLIASSVDTWSLSSPLQVYGWPPQSCRRRRGGLEPSSRHRRRRRGRRWLRRRRAVGDLELAGTGKNAETRAYTTQRRGAARGKGREGGWARGAAAAEREREAGGIEGRKFGCRACGSRVQVLGRTGFSGAAARRARAPLARAAGRAQKKRRGGVGRERVGGGCARASRGPATNGGAPRRARRAGTRPSPWRCRRR
jgi:hypothetical protein